MQKKFSYTLRVDISSPAKEGENAAPLKETGKMACTLKDLDVHTHPTYPNNLASPDGDKKAPVSITFVLDVNPDDHLYEAGDDVFMDELIEGSFTYITSYIKLIKDEIQRMRVTKEIRKDNVATNIGKPLGTIHVKDLAEKSGKDEEHYIYPVSYRRISKIVYRKNSPVLANVSLLSSLNGDMQPPRK